MPNKVGIYNYLIFLPINPEYLNSVQNICAIIQVHEKSSDMATPKSKARTSQFEFGPWKLMATESHILKSEGEDREK